MYFTVKTSSTGTAHIDGLDIRTAGSELGYSKSSCPALTRSGWKMGTGQKNFNELADAVKAAQKDGTRFCRFCAKAAAAMGATVELSAPAAKPEAPKKAAGCANSGTTAPEGRWNTPRAMQRRAYCSKCGRERPVTKTGLFRAH